MSFFVDQSRIVDSKGVACMFLTRSGLGYFGYFIGCWKKNTQKL